jgi:hypothetical protein
MNQADQRPGMEFHVDQTNLYREEVFTDLKTSSIRRLTPVKQDGSLDKTRPVLFFAQTQVMTQAGPIPVQAAVQAANLQEAMERCPAALRRELERLFAEVEELRRREASKIIVPPSTGKIQLP